MKIALLLSDFYQYGIRMNVWLWFHILIGGILTRIFNIVLSDSDSVLATFIVAILWEVYESRKDDIVAVYGSWSRFFYDAAGDVLGAVICGIVVVI